jgi:hypothetical protein
MNAGASGSMEILGQVLAALVYGFEWDLYSKERTSL